ncbi:amino acid/polyamine/organocation transporter, APC superfamily (TC 2.A.3) [Clostridium cavendishii DSM 21758]|uniref:Amino acid/polyamine/organocation transporter, APC superfamily (TC 2.A.3) n=1 Tax=Clostridium cavendishii DSM 21758 TaxID=1121302 RepID=A0A1M6D2E0_9CLOT|nr:APC family permease [Clostridium cavendishii]SHI67410.1 amino acid/polyamine/organocation transporter, APC superfamily (TC 2.A.3) [Clostridium cavendishii DSM 21758]
MSKLKTFLVGKPLKSSDIHHEKLSVFRGLPILSSDAISSVAYAVEEILWVLIPVIGLASFKYLGYVTLAILGLLSILIFSYRQTINSYPKGGGSYIVSKENLGEIPSLVAGASLTIDYILTVAVSTTAGVAAITSAFPILLRFKLELTIIIILTMAIGNLRGIRDSAKIFSLPTYFFLVICIIMVGTGLFKYFILGIQPVPNPEITHQIGDLTIFLFLKAFSSGCSALTGIEAVSDGVANFKDPAPKHAKQVLYLMFLIVFIIFGGISYLATIYHAFPTLDKTVVSQIAEQVFGKGSLLFLVMQFSTTLILIMAANTAFSDFPLLLSFISKDGYAPRQFAKRGDRLSFSNGILFLSLAAIVLVIIFRGENHLLIPLYSVGVFISFTLSQSGMVVKWYKQKTNGWIHKAMINGIGATITFVTAIVVSINKFKDGAWIVFILVPAVILLMKRINRHYKKVAAQLSLDNNYFPQFNETEAKRFIVPVASLNEAVIKTINYAKCLSNDITAFHISTDDAETEKLKVKWEKHNIDIPLIIKKDEYRDVLNPLLKFIDSEEFASKKQDMITVVIPQFVTEKWWGNLLHNQTAVFMKRTLLKRKNIAVISVPFIIKQQKL